jgi:lipid II:glycine glycyltransferase (peptidoglycan interpeptide bridge formation enzyme)
MPYTRVNSLKKIILRAEMHSLSYTKTVTLIVLEQTGISRVLLCREGFYITNLVSDFSNRIRISVVYVSLTKTLTEKEEREKEIEFESQHEEKDLNNEKKKENNKERVHGLHRVVCFDLQAGLPTPPGDDTIFYYRSKLLTYAFAVCDL